MINGFDQSEILEISTKKVAQQPAPFTKEELVYTDNLPGIELYSGNTIKTLVPTLMIAAGQLAVSNFYFRSTLINCNTHVNHHTIDIALTKPLFEASADKVQLRGDGQTSMGPLYNVNHLNNGNLLSSAIAFGEVFSDLSDDEIVKWGTLTGLKNKDARNTKSAIQVIQEFGADPEKSIVISADNRDLEITSPLFYAVRKMVEDGSVITCRDCDQSVKAKDGRTYNAIVAKAHPDAKESFIRYNQLIKSYQRRTLEYSENTLQNIFEILPSSKARYGISPDRKEMMRNSLRVYELLNFARAVEAQNPDPLKSI